MHHGNFSIVRCQHAENLQMSALDTFYAQFSFGGQINMKPCHDKIFGRAIKFVLKVNKMYTRTTWLYHSLCFH